MSLIPISEMLMAKLPGLHVNFLDSDNSSRLYNLGFTLRITNDQCENHRFFENVFGKILQRYIPTLYSLYRMMMQPEIKPSLNVDVLANFRRIYGTCADVQSLRKMEGVKDLERAAAILCDIVANNISIYEFPDRLMKENLSPFWINIIDGKFSKFNLHMTVEDKLVNKCIMEYDLKDELVKLFQNPEYEIDTVNLHKWFMDNLPETPYIRGAYIADRCLKRITDDAEGSKYRALQVIDDVVYDYACLDDEVDFARACFMELKRTVYLHIYYEVVDEWNYEDPDQEALRRYDECVKTTPIDNLYFLPFASTPEKSKYGSKTISDLNKLSLSEIAEVMQGYENISKARIAKINNPSLYNVSEETIDGVANIFSSFKLALAF